VVGGRQFLRKQVIREDQRDQRTKFLLLILTLGADGYRRKKEKDLFADLADSYQA
jgi:hypothetical protein